LMATLGCAGSRDAAPAPDRAPSGAAGQDERRVQADGIPNGFADVLDVTAAGCAASNAVPDDGKDDAPACACALAMRAPRGGRLHAPAGRFDIDSTLVVPRHVTVSGSGFGSVLAQPHALTGPLLRMQAESILRDVLLTQEQPLP